MPILNYTTSIDANKTVGEIQRMLALKGAKEISIDYQDGMPDGLRFMIIFCEQPIYFRLPCNVDGVYKALYRAKGVPSRSRAPQQARRVAWRIIKDWVEVQLAIVEAGQAQMTEVFLPYAIDANNQTFFNVFQESKQKLLTVGSQGL